MINQVSDTENDPVFSEISLKLWIYTNYHCNMACTYCVVEANPHAPRRILSVDFVKRLVDEALALGFEKIYFTGGEPFLLNEICEMLEYASQRAVTTVLTNAILLNGERLERLSEIRNGQLIIQVSLDGGCPEHHDPYRGKGSWQRTVRGLMNLQERGFQVRLSTTETPANNAHLNEICAFHISLGIPEEHHFIRPLARRGSSRQGLEFCKKNLAPEITVNADGVYWHPLATDSDLLVSEKVFPLGEAVEEARLELRAIHQNSPAEVNIFH